MTKEERKAFAEIFASMTDVNRLCLFTTMSAHAPYRERFRVEYVAAQDKLADKLEAFTDADWMSDVWEWKDDEG